MNEPLSPEVAILNAAAELPTAERAVYLAEACKGDAALHQRLQELLQAHDQTEGFLEVPPQGLDFNRTVLADVPVTEDPATELAATNCSSKSGREAAEWFIWPNRWNRSVAGWRSK